MIHVAFLWHMHQPFYRNLASLEGTLPWVRLHGIKDYYGMAAILEEKPPAKATFNWVPCLVEQLQALVAGEYEDRPFQVARMSADDLEEEDVLYMLQSFFRARRERIILPFWRYAELLELRGDDPSRFREKARVFSQADLRDLQVWANLAWFHKILQRSDPVVSTLIRKGSNFTEEEKQALLARQIEILGQVLGKYRFLAESGRIEISTSPHYHPILPLLLDMESARDAMPDVVLPSFRGPYAGDAARQLEMAVDLHTRTFGAPPRGLWPSEGSVSEAMIPLASGAGFKWIATDEGILGRSLGIDLTGDSAVHLVKPHVLYKPYRITAGEAEIHIVFRDRYLSDLLGFKYQHMGTRQAVGDFLGRLKRIRSLHAGTDLLVSIILDGENPWESYPEGGVDFLSLLYSQLVETDWVRLTTISEYLETHPEPHRLDRLHAGSWIDSNFSVWIGAREDNLAWDALGKAH
ncbi:MAG: glycoside hydrolase family 57 protein, partial [Planctomycetota bacterium]